MTGSVNASTLSTLADGVAGFQRKKSRAEAENWGYDRYEQAMDAYDDHLSWARSEHGMRKIGEGRDRITFTAGTAAPSNCVVKVSKSDGTRQNAEEVELWKQLGDGARQHVAPIVEWSGDYRWVVQRRADQGAPPGASKTVAERLHQAGWTCSDIRPDNVGMLGGEPVLMDLGVGLRQA